MKRRKFLRNASIATLGTAIPFKGMSMSFGSELLNSINCDDASDRILVILRLQGANDGLNTFIPYNYYDKYRSYRPSLHIPLSQIKQLDTTLKTDQKLYLNPSMESLKKIYERKSYNAGLRIINAVGYKNYNYSHFASDQVIWKGNDEMSKLDNGLLARYIFNRFKDDKNVGIKNGSQYDPYVVQFGNVNSINSFKINTDISYEYNGFGFLNTNEKQLLQASARYKVSRSEYGKMLSYIQEVKNQLDRFGKSVENSFNKGSNKSGLYTDETLMNQFKMVARLIKGGSKTKIYQCTLGGFDTHAAQKNKHNGLLNKVSKATEAFMDDLNKLGLSKRVVVLAYSEFGRRVTENQSNGTDHGNINTWFMVGNGVNSGVEGSNVDLTKVDGSGKLNENLTKINYKEIFSNILQYWLGANTTLVNAVGLPINSKLSLISNASKVNCKVSALESQETPTFTQQSSAILTEKVYSIYPNPAKDVFYIKSTKDTGTVMVELYSQAGHIISQTNVDLSSKQGINIQGLKAGIYFVRVIDVLSEISNFKLIKE